MLNELAEYLSIFGDLAAPPKKPAPKAPPKKPAPAKAPPAAKKQAPAKAPPAAKKQAPAKAPPAAKKQAPAKAPPAAKKQAPAKAPAKDKAAKKPAPAKAPAKEAQAAPTIKVSVQGAQDILIRYGAKIKADGKFAPATQKAWADAAKKKKLVPTFTKASATEANVDSATYSKLMAEAPAPKADKAKDKAKDKSKDKAKDKSKDKAKDPDKSALTIKVAVRSAQGILIRYGAKIKADGKFAPATQKAWADAAKKKKLVPTFTKASATEANVDSATYSKLMADAPAPKEPSAAKDAAKPIKGQVDKDLKQIPVKDAQEILTRYGAKLTLDNKYSPATKKAWADAAKKKGLDQRFDRVSATVARVSGKTYEALSAKAPESVKVSEKKEPPAAPGLTKASVGTLQDILLKLGANLGKAGRDGQWGPSTQKAWAAAANKRKLKPRIDRAGPTEAYVVPATYEALSKAAGVKTPPIGAPPPSAEPKVPDDLETQIKAKAKEAIAEKEQAEETQEPTAPEDKEPELSAEQRAANTFAKQSTDTVPVQQLQKALIYANASGGPRVKGKIPGIDPDGVWSDAVKSGYYTVFDISPALIPVMDLVFAQTVSEAGDSVRLQPATASQVRSIAALWKPPVAAEEPKTEGASEEAAPEKAETPEKAKEAEPEEPVTPETKAEVQAEAPASAEDQPAAETAPDTTHADWVKAAIAQARTIASVELLQQALNQLYYLQQTKQIPATPFIPNAAVSGVWNGVTDRPGLVGAYGSKYSTNYAQFTSDDWSAVISATLNPNKTQIRVPASAIDSMQTLASEYVQRTRAETPALPAEQSSMQIEKDAAGEAVAVGGRAGGGEEIIDALERPQQVAPRQAPTQTLPEEDSSLVMQPATSSPVQTAAGEAVSVSGQRPPTQTLPEEDSSLVMQQASPVQPRIAAGEAIPVSGQRPPTQPLPEEDSSLVMQPVTPGPVQPRVAAGEAMLVTGQTPQQPQQYQQQPQYIQQPQYQQPQYIQQPQYQQQPQYIQQPQQPSNISITPQISITAPTPPAAPDLSVREPLPAREAAIVPTSSSNTGMLLGLLAVGAVAMFALNKKDDKRNMQGLRLPKNSRYIR